MSVWAYAYVFLLSMVPGLEGRYALLVGPVLGIELFESFLVSSLSTVILSITLPLLFPTLDKVLSRSRNAILRKLYDSYIARARRKAMGLRGEGMLALALFVAIPLPATGVWTGAAIAYVLGYGVRSMVPLLVGGIACNTLVYLLGEGVL